MTHSKLPWRIRAHPGNPDDFFIQADRNRPDHPYDIEVLGDDTNSVLYPVEQKRADAELIVQATAAMQNTTDAWKRLLAMVAAHPTARLLVGNNLNGLQPLKACSWEPTFNAIILEFSDDPH